MLGVHGIGQRGKSSATLTHQWNTALASGFVSAGFGQFDMHVTVPYLSPLLTRTDPRGQLGAGPLEEENDDLTPAEVEFIENALLTLFAEVDDCEVDKLAASGLTLASLPAFPTQRGLKLLAALDGRWRGGGALAVKMLREVNSYLASPEIALRVRQLVQCVAADSTVVLAHSLGSIIAFDMLRRGCLPRVKYFVTLGSPLAWPTIRHRLQDVPDCQLPDLQAPLSGIDSWTNFLDTRDPVTAGLPLGKIWSQATDTSVTNPNGDVHGATGYLGQPGLAWRVSSWILA